MQVAGNKAKSGSKRTQLAKLIFLLVTEVVRGVTFPIVIDVSVEDVDGSLIDGGLKGEMGSVDVEFRCDGVWRGYFFGYGNWG
jgi:hypothetical protein